ncbi:hypothetical protein ACFP8Z_21490 [Gemmobacter lanyuensis]|uniref:hypothetical protein n=1 Tax=Gemmobacter lanyuensis TaxID=1054497 RepID=UPI00360BA8F7
MGQLVAQPVQRAQTETETIENRDQAEGDRDQQGQSERKRHVDYRFATMRQRLGNGQDHGAADRHFLVKAHVAGIMKAGVGKKWKIFRPRAVRGQQKTPQDRGPHK